MYSTKLLKALIASFVLVIGYYTFGQAEYFDRLFVGVLLSLLIVNYINKDFNFIGLLLILLFERLSEELFYFSMNAEYIKVTSYCVIFLVLYWLRYDKLALRLAIPLFFITLCAELYWFSISYDAPVVHYPLMLLILNLVTRHLIINRIPYTEKIIEADTGTHPLDWPMYNIAKVFVYIISASLIEYLVRHLTPFTPLYIYKTYPFATHLLTVVSMAYIVQYLFNRNFSFKF